jgi:ABC-type dipeptide/oligopeptide/nickel transport system permease subunit
MRHLRKVAICLLALTFAVSLGADLLAPHDYTAQFREHANEPPSHSFPLGTDELGRDRLSRLLQGSRVSLLCAPAAALLAMALAASIGIVAGYRGGWIDEVSCATMDLFLSRPWLFVLLTLRALLPLNSSPAVSIAATFLLLAMVGWASGARAIRASVATLRDSPAILHARAYGCDRLRLLCFHIVPNLRPVLSAQFWILVPVFLLTEANLGLLGLGITEPMPSWGNMLAELQSYQRIPEAPWILAPAVMLIVVIASLHFVVSDQNMGDEDCFNHLRGNKLRRSATRRRTAVLLARRPENV